MDLFHYILFWVCVIGLCLGSFFNVVILRSLSNESIVFPASKCPKCNHKLYFWHNIPVLSYILLGGKCYFCKEKIERASAFTESDKSGVRFDDLNAYFIEAIKNGDKGYFEAFIRAYEPVLQRRIGRKEH